MSLCRRSSVAAALCFGLLLPAGVPTALAAVAPAGGIRGRVLVDGKPAAGVAVAVLPFEDGFAAARREARREDLPKPLVSGTTRPDGTFAVAVPGPAARPSGCRSPEPRRRRGCSTGSSTRAGRTRETCGCRRPSPSRGGSWTSGEGRSSARPSPCGRAAAGGRRTPPRPPALPQATVTKADGTFRFEAAAEEGNRIRVEAPAFATQERQPVRAGALARPVTLASGRSCEGR